MRSTTLMSIIFMLLLLFTVSSSIAPAVAITWSFDINRLTTDSNYDGFPAIKQTANGTLWLVWSKSILGNLTLYYQTSPDLGITWSEEMNLTELLAPGNNQNPSITQAMNGTIWVAWTSDRPPAPQPPIPEFNLTADPSSLVIPKGASDTSTIIVTSINDFNDPVGLSIFYKPLGVSATLDPTSVTPPPNGVATSTLTVEVGPTATPGSDQIIVRGRAGGILRMLEIPLEITESAAANGLSQGTSAYQLSMSTSLTQDYEIYYKTSDDNGATWSSDAVLTSNNFDDLRPSIRQLSNGTIFLAWQTLESGNQDIYYKTTLDGTSWTSPTQLTTHSGNDKAPSVTQTADGKIWVTWSTDRTGDYEIFYKTYNGVSWSEDTRLTYTTNSDVTPAILQARDGNIYIFWCSMPLGGGGDIYYRYSSDNGVNWSANNQFTTDANEDMWPALTQTSDTRTRVVWVSNRADQPDGNWDIYHREGREDSLAGDVNLDGVVDNQDLTLLKQAFGAVPGDDNWNPDADLYYDFRIDTKDLQLLGENYGTVP